MRAQYIDYRTRTIYAVCSLPSLLPSFYFLWCGWYTIGYKPMCGIFVVQGIGTQTQSRGRKVTGRFQSRFQSRTFQLASRRDHGTLPPPPTPPQQQRDDKVPTCARILAYLSPSSQAVLHVGAPERCPGSDLARSKRMKRPRRGNQEEQHSLYQQVPTTSPRKGRGIFGGQRASAGHGHVSAAAARAIATVAAPPAGPAPPSAVLAGREQGAKRSGVVPSHQDQNFGALGTLAEPMSPSSPRQVGSRGTQSGGTSAVCRVPPVYIRRSTTSTLILCFDSYSVQGPTRRRQSDSKRLQEVPHLPPRHLVIFGHKMGAREFMFMFMFPSNLVQLSTHIPDVNAALSSRST